MNFIPAKESRFVIWFFYWYTRFLMKRRFRKIHIHQKYQPGLNSRSVYFMNHFYWWDGLLPLYLNNKLFKQNARAIMEDKQMKQYPFFAKIGAFSINLSDPRSSIQSLRYSVESMKRDHSCLFIYPQGEIVPTTFEKPEFKPGLAWLYQNLEEVDFVPIAFYIDYSKHHKPDLHISIGESVHPDNQLNKNELTHYFETQIHIQLNNIQQSIKN